ncbi:MAG: histidinol-phosphatase HisJ family protein [Eubacteriales bacterium]
MPIDYHIHTKMCGHAAGEMEEYVAVAKEKGLQEIGFSDHIPMYFLPEAERDLTIAMAEEELPLYVERVKEVQQKFYPYPVKFGIEADFIPGMEKELASILNKHDFDYILGSIHFLNGWGFDNSRYKAEYDKWEIYELYQLYFSTLGQAAASGLFDTMAHPDLIKKFGFKPPGDINGLYEETLKQVADSGVCIEVNTAGLRVPVGEIYPSVRFLELCYRFRVPVSLGSDAHKPDLVGCNLREALELLKSVGYSQVATFSGRHRKFCRI